MVQHRLQAKPMAVAAWVAIVFICANTASADHLLTVGQALDENRQKWDAFGIGNYDFQMQRFCYCIPSFTDPGFVHVRGGRIDSVEHAESGIALDAENYLTVEGLFDYATAAFEDHVFFLNASFDATLGYPTRISVDIDSGIADDEYDFFVSDLRVFPDGDLNLDGIVDLYDIASIVRNYGLVGATNITEGDLDGDGRVGLRDIALVQASFGETALSPTVAYAAVPEPSTTLLLLCGAATMLNGWRWRKQRQCSRESGRRRKPPLPSA